MLRQVRNSSDSRSLTVQWKNVERADVQQVSADHCQRYDVRPLARPAFGSARMEQALLFRGRSALGWSRRDVGIPGVANVEPLSARLHGDGEIVPRIDDLPRLVLHRVGPGLPTHVTGNAPGGVGAETGRDTGLLRLRSVLRKERANRRSAIRGWCARQQQHCMFIVETRQGIDVAGVISL